MPAELHDKMFVEAGMPVDEAAFANGLTMSRTGRVRAKKQHLRMETYLQSQIDGENDENSNHEGNGTFASARARTLPRPSTRRRNAIISPDLIETSDFNHGPGEILRNGTGQYGEGGCTPCVESSTKRPSSQNSSNRPRSTFERSNSHEELAQAVKYDRAQPKFKAMTLSRVPRSRNREDKPPLSPALKKGMASKFTENSPRKDKSPKFYVDVNGNDTSRKGSTLGRHRGKETSLGSEDELFIPRSNTFSTSNKPSKPFRLTRKSEADEHGKGVEVTLEDMLKSKAATQAFRDFLKSEFSEENLDFWLDCEQYKTLKGSKQIKMAFRIFSHYLARSAPREVNIVSEIRSRLEENLKNPNKNTFAEAQNCIYSLMKSDSFRRFTASDKYIKLQLTDPKLSFRLSSGKKTR